MPPAQAPAAPAAPANPSVLNEPPVKPVTPEDKVYPPATPPEPPATPTPPVPPATPPAVPPATPPATPPPADPPAPPPATPKPGDPPPTPPPGQEPAVDYDLKLPEGSPLSAEDLALTLKNAKEAKLSKEQATTVLSAQDNAARSVIDRQNVAFKATQAQWKTDAAKDPEFGGEAFAKNVEIAKRAWDIVASPALKAMADQTGLGNHPEVVRMMVKIGKMMAEDTMIRGAVGGVTGKKAPEDVLYGSPKSGSEPMK